MMDNATLRAFQAFVDTFSTMTCVISVETKEDGSYGDIRIVTGNKAYIDSIEHMPPELGLPDRKFVPNSTYDTYFPAEPNFFDFCYSCAVHKQPLHTYLQPDRYAGVWLNLFMMPLESDQENIHYCTYSQQITFAPDPKLMSNVSLPIASSVLDICIKLHEAADLREAVAGVLTDIRVLCGAAYCCLLLVDEKQNRCEFLGESRDENASLPTKEEWFTDDFYTIVETWPQVLDGSNCLIIKNDADMELIRSRSSIWYESLVKDKVSSLLLFPLQFHEEVIGYIWVGNSQSDDFFHVKEAMELMTYFIASEIANEQLLERLKELSSTDMMTKVGNRNAMNRCIDEMAGMQEGGPAGIVMVDLNGLKRINDEEGHEAGDQLLEMAAAVLQKVFPEDSIYRAGGDEFVVVLPGITEKELEEFDRQLQVELKEEEQLSMAAGSCYCPDCRDINTWMKIADERMYQAKRAYYAAEGIDRRTENAGA